MGQLFDAKEILGLPLMANLATTAPDGPRNAPVWFLWEDAALWMLSHEGASSASRLASDPRCAVEIVHFSCSAGILAHLGFRGRATVEPMDAALFKRLLGKYLGSDEASWNPWFIQNVAAIDDPGGRLLRLAPTSTFTNNVSYFRTGPLMAWP